jgi:hypothetical protein
LDTEDLKNDKIYTTVEPTTIANLKEIESNDAFNIFDSEYLEDSTLRSEQIDLITSEYPFNIITVNNHDTSSSSSNDDYHNINFNIMTTEKQDKIITSSYSSGDVLKSEVQINNENIKSIETKLTIPMQEKVSKPNLVNLKKTVTIQTAPLQPTIIIIRRPRPLVKKKITNITLCITVDNTNLVLFVH